MKNNYVIYGIIYDTIYYSVTIALDSGQEVKKPVFSLSQLFFSTSGPDNSSTGCCRAEREEGISSKRWPIYCAGSERRDAGYKQHVVHYRTLK
jgi:hypothetical protein